MPEDERNKRKKKMTHTYEIDYQKAPERREIIKQINSFAQ